MPRDSSGNYTLPALNPVVTGTTIASTWANNTLADMAGVLTASLDRSGNGGMLAALKCADGTLAAPGIAFASEPATGFYRSAANTVVLGIGGTPKVTVNGTTITIDSSITAINTAAATALNFFGSVTIGSNASPSSLVAYVGSGVAGIVAQGSATGSAYVSAGGAVSGVAGVALTSSFDMYQDSSGDGYLNNRGIGSLFLANNGLTRVWISPTGKVGIGVAPSGNFLMESLGGSIGFSLGRAYFGASGGDYPLFGYNFRTTTTSGQYKYDVAAGSSWISFVNGAITCYNAVAGVAGNVISANASLGISVGGNVTIQPPTSGYAFQVYGIAGTHSTQIADSNNALFNTGFLESPIRTLNGNYTCVLSDNGKTMDFNAANLTCAIPSNASVPYPIGTILSFTSEQATNQTISINADTLVWAGSGAIGSRTLGQYGRAFAQKRTATRWLISGINLT